MYLDDNLLRTSISLSRISYALYLLCDNLVWLSRIHMIKINEERMIKFANSYLLYSSMLALIKDLYQLKLILGNDRHLEFTGSGLSFIPKYSPKNIIQNKVLLINIIKNLCDILICLKHLNKITLTPVKIGLFGIISSILGILY